MNSTIPTQSIIQMFVIVEEYLGSRKLDLALSHARTILISDPNNYYAQAIERRLARILSIYPKAVHLSTKGNALIKKAIVALQHICCLAIKQLESFGSSIHP